MNKEIKETINVRALSVGFIVLTLGIFKPFGLDADELEIYIHLFAIFVMGMACCALTEIILKYVVRMPRSMDKGVSYIISRNLRFQLINTPLVSFVICLYRNYALCTHNPENHLSVANFLETLVILSFCSFIVGLYWRFKFRSRFLQLELEELRVMNDQLKTLGDAEAETVEEVRDEQVTLCGTTSDTVTLDISNLLYIETVGNYVKVYHLAEGKICVDMLRVTSKLVEEQLASFPQVVRCHRAFLVNLSQVEQIVSRAGSVQLVISHCSESIPVSRSNIAQIRERLSTQG